MPVQVVPNVHMTADVSVIGTLIKVKVYNPTLDEHPVVRVFKRYHLRTGYLHFYGKQAFGTLCDELQRPVRLKPRGTTTFEKVYIAFCSSTGGSLPERAPLISSCKTTDMLPIDLATAMHIEMGKVAALVPIDEDEDLLSTYRLSTPHDTHTPLWVVPTRIEILRTSVGIRARVIRILHFYVARTEGTVMPPWDFNAGRIVAAPEDIEMTATPSLRSQMELCHSTLELEPGEYYELQSADSGENVRAKILSRSKGNIYTIRRFVENFIPQSIKNIADLRAWQAARNTAAAASTAVPT